MRYRYDPIKTGQRIKEERLKMGLTLYELGDLVGKHLSTIGKYEHGVVDISPSVIADISNILKVLPKDLLVFEDES